MSRVPRIALTPGEPAGIGPDLVVALAQSDHAADIVAIADPALLQQRAEQLGLPLTLAPVDFSAAPTPAGAGHLHICPVTAPAPVTPGQLEPANAPYVLETLRRAARASLDGDCQALVTGPVQKSVINEAGIAFSGHTEFFAEQARVDKVVMMLATEGLRVALVTTHLPLAEVPGAITADNVGRSLRILARDLRHQFGIDHPRIAVLGLNPHAGEGGHMGREEIDTIIPALRACTNEPFTVLGPLPADTAFTPKVLERCDAVLAMYHDQGLPVLKYKGFGRAANITLGLPFIRTSVDHGTALDLAGTGRADGGSLAYALNCAIDMARQTPPQQSQQQPQQQSQQQPQRQR